MPGVLRRAILPIALGCLTTLALAWLLAAGIARGRPVWSSAQRTFDFAPGRVFTASRGQWTGNLSLHIIDAWSDQAPAYAEWFDPLLPPWAHPVLIRPHPPPPPQTRVLRSVVASGWPFLALWSASEATADALARGPLHVTAGIMVSDSWTGFGSRSPTDPPVLLPTRPLWPNFLLDATIFAAAWSLILFSPPALRRARRRRAGRCIHCGYDLRALDPGLPCPECGRRRGLQSAPSSVLQR